MTTCCGSSTTRPSQSDCPLTYFDAMIGNCLAYAQEARAAGKPVVGILCEYTPREVIMAAGAVPVCLCGGSAATIPAAEQDLPANLCPLIKSTYGYHAQRSNPFLEMADLIVAETTCDGKKKMYELMGATRPLYVLELPQKPDDADAFAHWEAELRKFKAFLEQRYSRSISPACLQAAIKRMNRERQLRRELAALMKADPPPLTGRQLLNLKSSISGICADFAQYERALEMFGGKTGPATRHCEESSTKQSRRPDGKIRVLMTGVPMAHGAERVLDIIEAHGTVVVALESCSGLKPIAEDVDANAPDPMRAIAEKYFHLPCSVMTHNDARLDQLRQLAVDYNADCVVELIWQACLTYSVESARVKHLVEDELGLPYLPIETDYADADSARIAVRVEALMETVRARAAQKIPPAPPIL